MRREVQNSVRDNLKLVKTTAVVIKSVELRGKNTVGDDMQLFTTTAVFIKRNEKTIG